MRSSVIVNNIDNLVADLVCLSQFEARTRQIVARSHVISKTISRTKTATS